jgi:endonuclease YncB( thermonuclease family)
VFAKCFACIGIALSCACPAAEAQFEARIAQVIDGDTLDLVTAKARMRVRLLDIDAPERKQPYGHRSRQSLIAICGGEFARIDTRGRDRDKNMRAVVKCNGTDAGAEQVRLGMAWVIERDAASDSTLHALQAEARAARRGLWADKEPVPPWEWRGQGGIAVP